MGALQDALADYNGKGTAVLAAARDSIQPSQARLKEAVALAACPDANLAAGATWVFRAWLAGDARCTRATVTALAEALSRVVEPWAAQHIAQSIGYLVIPDELAEAFAGFLEEGCHSPRPFLRAWCMDGLHRLALQHERYLDRADQRVAAALEDPAASVRARARRVMAEG